MAEYSRVVAGTDPSIDVSCDPRAWKAEVRNHEWLNQCTNVESDRVCVTIPIDFNAEEPVDLTQISDLEVRR
jgi:hypothetical protein